MELPPLDVSATLVASLLVSVMYTSSGAGSDKLTGKAVSVNAGAVITLAGKMIPVITDTATVALDTFGTVELAVIVVEPSATPVTGTETLVAPVVKVTDGGTVAALVFEEIKLTTKPAGAGPDKFKVRFCVEPVVILTVLWAKLSELPTVTVGLAGTCT